MKVIVIGGGVVGASAAYHLSQNEAIDVTLIDNGIEGKATFAGAGIICPWISKNQDNDWFKIASRGAAYYPKLISSLQSTGATDTGYKVTGALATSDDLETVHQLLKEVEEKKADFPMIGDVKVLEAGEAKELFPPLRDHLHGLFISGAARLDGRLLANALIEGIKQKNGKVLQDTVSLKKVGNQVVVSTSKGELTADRLIVAAGAWTKDLLQAIDIPIEVEPQRGQIIHLGTDEATSDWPMILPQESSHYIVPFDDQRVVFGATREDETGFDYRVTAGGIQEVLGEGLKVAPGIKDGSLDDIRVGFRPVSPDNNPLLGKVPDLENLIIATGLGSTGLTSGPYVGALAAKIALDKEIDIDLKPYDPLRQGVYN